MIMNERKDNEIELPQRHQPLKDVPAPVQTPIEPEIE